MTCSEATSTSRLSRAATRILMRAGKHARALLFASCLASLPGFLMPEQSAIAGTPDWITDKNTGCKIWNDNPTPGQSVSWSGSCVNEMADGKGKLVWKVNGLFNAELSYLGEENGVLMKEGRTTAVFDLNRVRVDLSEWGPPPKGFSGGTRIRFVTAYIPAGIDLFHECLWKPIVAHALQVMTAQKLDHSDYESPYLRLRYENKEYPPSREDEGRAYVWCSRGKCDYRDSSKVGLVVVNERRKEWAVRRAAEQAGIDAIAAKKAAAEKAEAEKKAAAHVREQEQMRLANLSQFKKQYSVTDVITDLAALDANPFAYDKKTVAICVKFQTMTAATSAVFEGGNMWAGTQSFLFEGVPSTQFKKQGEVFLLAGRVLGKAPLKTGLGEVSLVRFNWVGAKRVASCEDVLKTKLP